MNYQRGSTTKGSNFIPLLMNPMAMAKIGINVIDCLSCAEGWPHIPHIFVVNPSGSGTGGAAFWGPTVTL
jgi:hypothetical protein